MDYTCYYQEKVQIGTDYNSVAEVAVYDERMSRTRDFAAEVEAAATALRLSSDSVVWDIGTGTSEIALGLARRCRRVEASDISSVMLDYSRTKAQTRGIANVFFHNGGFLAGFYPEEPLDGCITQLALHHLPDAWKMVALQRIAGALKPGGRFFLKDVIFPDGQTDYPAAWQASVAALERHSGEAQAVAYARHIRQEYSTFEWVIEGMLQRAGFSIISRNVTTFLTDYTCEKTR